MTERQSGQALVLASALALLSVASAPFLTAANAQPANGQTTAAQSPGAIASGAYVLDPHHHYLTFSYDHLGFSRPVLRFDDFAATLTIDSAHPANSHVEADIATSSLHSGVAELDGHLASAGLFNAAQFPAITFRSTHVTPTSATTATIDGDLTIKGVTHPVTLNATLNRAAANPMSNRPTLGFSATGQLLRSQWGLGLMAPSIGDQVDFHIEAEFTLAPG